ncbi:MAG: hypothetical protein K2I48_00595 [Muribaculaceae bacterium]|nr:hypothetical protein [Muribaculaceae bacterium]
MKAILLVEEMRDNKPFSALGAEINNGQFILTRIDFQEWERNRHTGQVEISYTFDVENTARLKSILETVTNEQFLIELKRRFGGRSATAVMGKICNFCNRNDLHSRYDVWY